MMSETLVSDQERAAFERDGFVLLKGFYDPTTDLLPIHQGIYDIIGLVLDKYGIQTTREPFSQETFDSGIDALVGEDRKLGGVVYDAVKQIPAFVRLVASVRHEELFRSLRPGSAPGVAAGGFGVRIDLPHEERFQAPWHQDYPNQLRSTDGIVFWSPLRPVTQELGPVRFCVGSHQEGPFRVRMFDPRNPEKTGPYAMIIDDEAETVKRFPIETPLSEPGDLLLIDYMTLHASTMNRGQRPRWTMQMRYFNFRNPRGVEMNWAGSFAAGVSLSTLHPELVVKPGS